MLGTVPLALRAFDPESGVGPLPDTSTWFRARRPSPSEYFGDVPLLTHENQPVRFFSDLLRDRTVLIQTVATQCRGTCITTTHRLALVRDALGERFGSSIFFVSLTTDPARDTPETMARFAREHGVSTPGWTFVTGRRDSLQHVLGRLGHRFATEHPQFGQFLLGNVAASRWQRLRADAAPRTVAERLLNLAELKAEG